MSTQDPDQLRIRNIVEQKYGAAARIAMQGKDASCCGSASCCAPGGKDAITSNLYGDAEAAEVPETALLASLGCGNPTALAELSPGEVILDLGSGGGIDVLLSAKRVGPTGFAYGLDMTDDMLAVAERNRKEAGAENVKFLKGHIEQIPLPDNSIDVILSNCVINLSTDKDRVLSEAFRVLKPGGRFAVSDVVVEGELPQAVRSDMEAYVGCVAGALESSDYLAKLTKAGFIHASIEPTRRYRFADLDGSACSATAVSELTIEQREKLDGRILSGFIRAQKPERGGA